MHGFFSFSKIEWYFWLKARDWRSMAILCDPFMLDKCYPSVNLRKEKPVYHKWVEPVGPEKVKDTWLWD